MGITWSNRRRNNFIQNPPPQPPQLPPPPPPPPYYYSSESHHPPPPPPPQQSYYYPPSTTPYTPQPQPQPHSFYFSNPNNNYPPNSTTNRIQYHPSYHLNQQHQQQPQYAWPPPPPSFYAPAAASSTPPPYVDHQTAKKIRNNVNVHKDTLRLEVDQHNPDHYLVSFVFDAVFDGSITVFYFAKEEDKCRFVPLFPDAFVPVKVPFKKGVGQKFAQPSGTGIDLGFFELDDLSKPSPGEDVFPLVICAETCLETPSENETPKTPDDSVLDASPHMQITQAVLEKSNGGGAFQIKVVRQILWIDGVRYELRELYGIGSSEAAGFDDSDPGKECVICMTEPKDTAVLPCRHMCLCSECAKALRLQSNKCPICRQPIEELMEIRVKSSDP
ncbi:putative transcription factor C2H2 family [Medicago truncatula]|uniref:RING-type E3 ubiquitin transferase n=1 Tax=Medicago truncatula TaxID=3880 RepID=A0A072V5Z5_MEDTR|nr:probable E3 ubiquitin-protein ligase LUL3 [Medicago truncatula]KEH36768.1 zinc finger, C3HC4 type (RING finger) protein [Medicago truncatula]RHN72445.1 putative transcription factor C2H2 family [Medicago truncatula]